MTQRAQVQLKEVLAIIRPEGWAQTKAQLQQLPLPAFTQQRVLGRGRGRGLRYLPRQGAARQAGIRYLPKRMVSWIVEEDQVEPLINAIMQANHTGHMGDGKIFVLPIANAIRIRTGEHGRDAIHAPGPCEIVAGKAQQPVDMQQELVDAPRQ
jgi:nitrogen regulatory protein PII 2